MNRFLTNSLNLFALIRLKNPNVFIAMYISSIFSKGSKMLMKNKFWPSMRRFTFFLITVLMSIFKSSPLKWLWSLLLKKYGIACRHLTLFAIIRERYLHPLSPILLRSSFMNRLTERKVSKLKPVRPVK
jgi:hypothetical protein